MCVDVVLDLTSTWGDIHYIGLTGLELVGTDGQTVSLDINMIDAEPRDLHHLPGHEDDDRTLDKYCQLILSRYLSRVSNASLLLDRNSS